MKGKEKCKALKEIRRQIAEKNDITYVVSECTFQGECRGTCPKCESELKYLERELAIRQSLGKAVAIAGITAGVCTSLTACTPLEVLSDIRDEIIYQLSPPSQHTTGAAPAPTGWNGPSSEEEEESEEESYEELGGDVYIGE